MARPDSPLWQSPEWVEAREQYISDHKGKTPDTALLLRLNAINRMYEIESGIPAGSDWLSRHADLQKRLYDEAAARERLRLISELRQKATDLREHLDSFPSLLAEGLLTAAHVERGIATINKRLECIAAQLAELES